MTCPGREVRMEVLQRGAAQSSLGVEAQHDRVDSGDECGVAQTGAPVDRAGQVCDVLVAADGPQREALGDRLATDGYPAQEGVELASSHVGEPVALDVVADELCVVHQELDLLSRQVEVPLDVVLRETAGTATETLARELLNGLDARGRADEEPLGLGRIRLREVETGHALSRDAHRDESDVPAIAPVPADLLAPRRRHEARLDAESLGDELARIHVVAGHLVAGELVRRAFRLGQPRYSLDAVRLRCIGGVGGEDERAAGEDLGKLVGGRVTSAGRRASGTTRGHAGDGHRWDDQQDDRDRQATPAPRVHLRSVLRGRKARRRAPGWERLARAGAACNSRVELMPGGVGAEWRRRATMRTRRRCPRWTLRSRNSRKPSAIASSWPSSSGTSSTGCLRNWRRCGRLPRTETTRSCIASRTR